MTLFTLSKKQIPWCSESLLMVKAADLILQDAESQTIFFQQDLLHLTNEDKDNAIFIGELNHTKIFALEKSGLESTTSYYMAFRSILDTLTPGELKTFFRSCHLLNWHKQSLFCGSCGAKMRMAEEEFVKICHAHPNHRLYPHYSPSMIVLVRHGSKLLLGRSAHFAKGMYSTLAGFVEAGETVEEAVAREVMEEVGINVKNIRPISTSPWPFPNTLMLAYEAEAVSSKLRIDPTELEDAQWFDYDNLPILPPKATISYQLISRGIRQCINTSLRQRTR